MNIYACTLLWVISLQPTPISTPGTDSSGIYHTKEDFLHNRISNLSGHRIKIKHYPFWRSLPLNIEKDDQAFLRQADGAKKVLTPDSVYGFINAGIKYVYSSAEKCYLAVLNDQPPVYFFIKEKEVHSFKWDFVDDSLLYCRTLGEPLKVFTPENINRDFAADPLLLQKFNDLQKTIRRKGYDTELHHHAFLKFRKEVQQCLGL